MAAEIKNRQAVCRTSAVSGWSGETGSYAVAHAVNELAAAGASCMGADALIVAPPACRSKVYVIKKKLQKVCREHKIELKEIRVQEDHGVSRAVIIVTALGEIPGIPLFQADKVRPGQQIVLTKWVGMSGMLRAVEECAGEIDKRFSPAFLRQIMSYKKQVFASDETRIAVQMHASGVWQAGAGGIYEALWRLAAETGAGLDLDMKRLSILQETIEVCEYFQLNPYQLYSAGCYLITAESGRQLADALNEAGIKASVIGTLTDGNDKIIHNGAEIRYIDRPSPDEIGKIGARR